MFQVYFLFEVVGVCGKEEFEQFSCIYITYNKLLLLLQNRLLAYMPILNESMKHTSYFSALLIFLLAERSAAIAKQRWIAIITSSLHAFDRTCKNWQIIYQIYYLKTQPQFMKSGMNFFFAQKQPCKIYGEHLIAYEYFAGKANSVKSLTLWAHSRS